MLLGALERRLNPYQKNQLDSASPFITRINLLLSVENGPMAKLYAGGMCERGILKNFILCHRAGKAYYLCSETATYIGSGEDVKGNNNYGRQEKQMRTELHIWSIN